MTTVTPGRGRPKTFDEETTLDIILELFWSKGYAAVSLQDIERATGLNKSSIYNTYGSKSQILALAIDRYVEAKASYFDKLNTGTRGLDDILEFLQSRKRLELQGKGCLGLNVALDLQVDGQANKSLQKRLKGLFYNAVTNCLERAADQGEIEPEQIEVYVHALENSSQSFNIGCRSNLSEEKLRRHLDLTARLVESWRLTPS